MQGHTRPHMQSQPNLPELWSAAVSEGEVVGGQGGGVQDDLGIWIYVLECFIWSRMTLDLEWFNWSRMTFGFELWNGSFGPGWLWIGFIDPRWPLDLKFWNGFFNPRWPLDLDCGMVYLVQDDFGFEFWIGFIDQRWPLDLNFGMVSLIQDDLWIWIVEWFIWSKMTLAGGGHAPHPAAPTSHPGPALSLP